MDNAQQALEAVKAIHYPWKSDQWLPEVITVCHECQDQRFPCQTMRIIAALEPVAELEGKG